MSKVKKFFRDLIAAVLAFYVPVIILYVIYQITGPGQGEGEAWRTHERSNLGSTLRLLQTIIPTLTSLAVFFWSRVKWKEKPNALTSLLGIWIGGPISFIAGAYIGFLGALLLLTLIYLISAIVLFVKRMTTGTKKVGE